MTRFLDQFDVVLFDMNGTFVFGHDRFGPDEDYFATYRAVGGDRLNASELARVMKPSCEALLRIYETPAHFENFPTLAECFREFGNADADDIPFLERVFAAHEIGRVPLANQQFLKHLATTHQLGVVSNICAHPNLWIAQHENADTFNAFTSRVFSSEGRTIKPSLTLFHRALADFSPNSRVLFVGDSLERDMIPAKSLGLATVWIAARGSENSAADRVITELVDLANLI